MTEARRAPQFIMPQLVQLESIKEDDASRGKRDLVDTRRS